MLSEAFSRERVFPETFAQQWSIPRFYVNCAATAIVTDACLVQLSLAKDHSGFQAF
jgi:hypothetical protein